jgi:hypothetical protein
LIYFATSIPLLAWHTSQTSPSSSIFGVAIPGLINAVANQATSKKIAATVRIKKKVFVS